MKPIQILKFIQLLGLLCTASLQAQDWTSAPPVHYPMPANVWEFEKFGGAPINEYRGLANISVPLYQINVDGVQLPLAIDYYSGGIRVSEIPGIVGTGWSFNIPTITQQIKDKNDYNFNTTHQKLPPFQGNPVMPVAEVWMAANGDWNTDINYHYNVGTVDDIPLYRYVTNNKLIDHNGYYNVNFPADSKYQEMFEPNSRIVDTEPDIFKVTLNGVEIKFCRTMSTAADSWQPFEMLPLQVINKRGEYKVETISGTPSAANNWLAIAGIKITDPGSNQYIFAKIDQGTNETPFINYRLTKIITSANKEITLTYSAPVTFVEPSKLNFTYYRRTGNTSISDILSGVTGTYTAFDNFTCSTLGVQDNDEVTCQQTPWVSYQQSFLESITTPTEAITFTYGTREDFSQLKKLSTFEVRNIFGTKTKKFIFDYDYFSQSGNFKRLKLLSVQEENSEPYSFYYNSIALPAFDSYAIDYWGFYNGTNNTSLKLNLAQLGYPQYTENNTNFNSNLTYAKACSLEKVVYPTKGYTKYEYGSNQFDNLLYSPPSGVVINTGAGLRIQNIKDYDADNTIEKNTSYTYFEGKCIAKRVLAKQSYEIFGKSFQQAQQWEHILKYATPCIVANFNNYVNQNIDSGGDYIGYGKVIIKEIGPYNNGKIERLFSNTEELCINPNGNFFPQATNYQNKDSAENGKILHETIYNDQDAKVSQTDYTYATLNGFGSTYGIAKQACGVVMELYGYSYAGVYGGDPIAYYNIYPRTLATFYPVYSKVSLLTRKISTEYLDGGSIAKTTNYAYDTKNNIYKTYTTVPGLSISDEETVFTYTTNTSHAAKNLFTLPLSKITQQGGETVQKVQYTYQESGNVTRAVQFDVIPNGITTAAKHSYYDQYDAMHNILRYHQDEGIVTSVIWGYNETLPVAKIENVAYNDINPSLITEIKDKSDSAGEEGDLLIALQNLRAALPDAMVTTFTYKPLVGMTSITDPKGLKTTYVYDDAGRLLRVLDADGNIVSENEYHYKP